MRVMLWLSGMFLAIGVISLSIGVFVFLDARSFAASSVPTTGTVVEVEERDRRFGASYHPRVHFVTADGQAVQFTSSTGDFEGRDGETVAVRYDPANPADAKIDSFFQLWGFSAIFLGVGGFFSLIGTGFIGSAGYTKFNRNRVITHGRMIFTEFKGTEQNTQLTVHHQHPYQIVSEWVDPLTGQIHEFKSEYLWTNPGEITSKEIRVYVNPKNPKKYFMDISFLAA